MMTSLAMPLQHINLGIVAGARCIYKGNRENWEKVLPASRGPFVDLQHTELVERNLVTKH